MPSAEIAFEALTLALESTKGTPITNPTHYFPLAGTLTPNSEKYRPEESRGTLAQFYREKTIRRGAAWEASGGLDLTAMPLFMNLAVNGALSAPTTPTDGVLTRLWTGVPSMTSDNLDSATIWFGDPNVQVWRAPYCMVDSLTVDADASGTDGVTMSISGQGRYPAKVSAPTLPAQSVGDLLIPGLMQFWLDTSSSIGTTEITGRVISVNWNIPTGVSYKRFAGGPTNNLSFTKHGRGKFAPTMTVRVELSDASVAAEFEHWDDDVLVKARSRLNGSLIESVGAGPTLYYNYAEMDIYGYLDAFAWGDLEGTNRTMEFTITGLYDATLGANYALRAQNTKTTI